MNKIKLPSMVEYLDLIELKLKNAKIDTEYQLLSDVLRVKGFLKKQPNVSMFVPAFFENGEWIVLEEPKEYDCFIKGIGGHIDLTFQEYKQYQTALDNVIFEGFEVEKDTYKSTKRTFWKIGTLRIAHELVFHTGKVEFTFDIADKAKTIEDLTKHNLTLTPKFAKELGLI
jgi:hypothetical protein